jgi:hypothetical protein
LKFGQHLNCNQESVQCIDRLTTAVESHLHVHIKSHKSP